jgi:hypothetical protein
VRGQKSKVLLRSFTKLENLIFNPNSPDLPIPLQRHSFRREGTETLVPQVEIH